MSSCPLRSAENILPLKTRDCHSGQLRDITDFSRGADTWFTFFAAFRLQCLHKIFKPCALALILCKDWRRIRRNILGVSSTPAFCWEYGLYCPMFHLLHPAMEGKEEAEGGEREDDVRLGGKDVVKGGLD